MMENWRRRRMDSWISRIIVGSRLGYGRFELIWNWNRNVPCVRRY
jgi:hypothetical protein